MHLRFVWPVYRSSDDHTASVSQHSAPAHGAADTTILWLCGRVFVARRGKVHIKHACNIRSHNASTWYDCDLWANTGQNLPMWEVDVIKAELNFPPSPHAFSKPLKRINGNTLQLFSKPVWRSDSSGAAWRAATYSPKMGAQSSVTTPFFHGRPQKCF